MQYVAFLNDQVCLVTSGLYLYTVMSFLVRNLHQKNKNEYSFKSTYSLHFKGSYCNLKYNWCHYFHRHDHTAVRKETNFHGGSGYNIRLFLHILTTVMKLPLFPNLETLYLKKKEHIAWHSSQKCLDLVTAHMICNQNRIQHALLLIYIWV